MYRKRIRYKNDYRKNEIHEISLFLIHVDGDGGLPIHYHHPDGGTIIAYKGFFRIYL